jgi:hypothetical protein
MATILFILFLLSVYHFIYDSILLPSLRLDLRYRLFVNRDKLVKLKILHNDKISDDIFNSLYSSINGALNRLPYLSVSLYLDAKKEFESNEQLRNKVEKRIQLINSCPIEEIRKISNATSNITFFAFALNTGSWILYLLPILILVYVVKQIFKLAFGLKRLAQELTFTPDYEFDKLVPNGIVVC